MTRALTVPKLPLTRRRLMEGALAAGLLAGQSRLAFAQGRLTLHRGNGAEPGSLDPHRVAGTWESRIVGEMLMGLMTEDAAGQAVPGMAIAQEASADGLTWTFTIRPDAVWSDGTPVTAGDFEYAWKRILDPATAAEYASILHGLKNARAVNLGEMPVDALGVRASGDKTLVVELEHPMPYLLEMITHTAFSPVPRHQVETLGEDWVKPGSYLSNGAYKLADWRPNDRIILTRNEKFWDNANVQIDEVIFYSISDNNAALRRFRTGELDMNPGWPVQQGPDLKKSMPDQALIHQMLGVSYIVANTKRPPFDDVRVRKALSLAVDRKAITDQVFMGFSGVPAYSFVPTGIANYPGTPKVGFVDMAMPERQAEARRLLAEAGFSKANPLRFALSYRSGNDDARRYVIAVQAMWKMVGIEAELDPREPKVLYDLLKEKDFTVGEAGWVADFNDPYNFLFLAHSKSERFNYPNFNDAEYDRLLDAAEREPDLGRRGELLAEAEQILLDSHTFMPTYFLVSRNLVGRHVTGYVGNVNDVYRTRWLGIDASKKG
ncbi:MAG: peptide ABC transporter substrate-binding protein [Alphaproteobacteria bacterium]|nr:peptide ABC transporter substrate-binding protein [Alphaproteobacteria bacterium]